MVHDGEDQVMLDCLKRHWYLLLMRLVLLDAVYHRNMLGVLIALACVCVSYHNRIKNWYRNRF